MSKIVVAKNLKIGYKNDVVLENASFSINSGEFVFLTGASGSGKTTLIKNLYGDLRPKGGYLNIGGIEMGAISASKLMQLRRRMGIVFQDYKLIKDWNIEKNIRLPLTIMAKDEKFSQQEVVKYLSKVKLSHKADNYPYELSGGEQQRAAVIRAIIHKPALILADEPTGNLDDYSAGLVMELFEFANKMGITIVIATHHLPETFEIPYRNIHIEGKKLYEVS